MAMTNVKYYANAWAVPCQVRWQRARKLSFYQWRHGWQLVDVYVDASSVLAKVVNLPNDLIAKDYRLYILQHHRDLLGWQGDELCFDYVILHQQDNAQPKHALILAMTKTSMQQLQQAIMQDQCIMRLAQCGWYVWLCATIRWLQASSKQGDYNFVIHCTAKLSLCFGLYKTKLISLHHAKHAIDHEDIRGYMAIYQKRCRPLVDCRLWVTNESKAHLSSLPESLTSYAMQWIDVIEPLKTAGLVHDPIEQWLS